MSATEPLEPNRLSAAIAVGAAADDTTRRDFLKAFALGLGMLQLGGCAQVPDDPIVPSVDADAAQETDAVFYATTLNRGGYAQGVSVKTRYGHPIKVEGNVAHPASQGGTDIFAQAAIYSLWDARRLRNVANAGQIATWAAFERDLETRLALHRQTEGRGIHILAEPGTSPTHARLRAALAQKLPQLQWHGWSALPRDNVYAGAMLAFGRALEPRYDFTQANVVLALDADAVTDLPGAPAHARALAQRRNPGSNDEPMLRLYVAEPCPTSTGALADHRLALAPAQLAGLADAVLRAVQSPSAPTSANDDRITHWAQVIARDLRAHAPHAVVVAGDRQPAAVHAVVHRINAALNADGTTVHYSTPLLDTTDQLGSLQQLCTALREDRVALLLTLGGNPRYTAPADFDLDTLLRRAAWHAHLGLEPDETGNTATWQLPLAHELESWGDLCAFDGTVSIQQPTVQPLHGGRTLAEVLALLLGAPQTAYELVRATWATGKTALTPAQWNDSLRRGALVGSADADIALTTPTFSAGASAAADMVATEPTSATLDLLFGADGTIGDGRHFTNAWLQELPKPVTQLTWDNAALLSPHTAKRLGLDDGDKIELGTGASQIPVAVIVVAGHAEECISLSLGYGRASIAGPDLNCGFNAAPLRTSTALWHTRATVRRTGARYALATTQRNHIIDTDNAVRIETPMHATTAPSPAAVSLFAPMPSAGYAWGMAINLGACTGCKVCTIACQAENNIPTVGKAQVARGREMHWIRVDTYIDDTIEHAPVHFQPVPCMHCERAPCEVVCPVGATVHDSEGLNVQVYNRCVGTRFCANNCPYKVRRFNFLQLTGAGMHDYANPDVTVRNRGVMEKCTYCVQRIETARIDGDKRGEALRDGDVRTACQAACPTGAIVFGDLNDPASAVARAKADPRNYALLEELNTGPRTTYLAKRVNPNPEFGSA